MATTPTCRLLVVVVFLSLQLTGSIAVSDRHGPAGYPCSLCPPGHGVTESCNPTNDTICTPCPPGYHSTAVAALQGCHPCSRCGDDLFELYRCNSTNDVFCELCAWGDALHNEDYLRKCLTSSANDQWRADGGGLLLGPLGAKVKDDRKVKDVPRHLMLGDAPQSDSGTGSRSSDEIKSDDVSKEAKTISDFGDLDPPLVEPMDADDDRPESVIIGVMTNDTVSLDQTVPEPEHVSETDPETFVQSEIISAGNGTENSGIGVSGGTSEAGFDSVEGLPEDIDPEVHQGITSRQPVPGARSFTTKVKDFSRSTLPDTLPGELPADVGMTDVAVVGEDAGSGKQALDPEGSGEIEADPSVTFFTVIMTDHRTPDHRTPHHRTPHHRTSVSRAAGHGVLGRTPPVVSTRTPPVRRTEKVSHVSPRTVTAKWDQTDSLRDAPFLIPRQKNDEPEIQASHQGGSQVFPIFMAVITSGIIFFAVGFFLNRFRSTKSVSVATQQKQRHDAARTADAQCYEMTSLSSRQNASAKVTNSTAVPEVKVTVHDDDSSQNGIQGHEDDEPTQPLLKKVAPARVPRKETSGKYQSPVYIEPENATIDNDLTGLEYQYVPENTRTATNTGSTVWINIDYRGSVLRGGPMEEKRYCLDHIEFRWGARTGVGSEHVVNGNNYSAEVQLVHWNVDDCRNYQEASQSEDGLVILSILMEVTNEDHPGLQTIVDVLHSIRYKGDTVEVPHHFFDPSALLPANVTDYWTYPGSLTSPPYYETVTWVVLRQPIRVAERQMSKFRDLFRHERDEGHVIDRSGQDRLIDNQRQVQPLAGRSLRASFNCRLAS